MHQPAQPTRVPRVSLQHGGVRGAGEGRPHGLWAGAAAPRVRWGRQLWNCGGCQSSYDLLSHIPDKQLQNPHQHMGLNLARGLHLLCSHPVNRGARRAQVSPEPSFLTAEHPRFSQPSSCSSSPGLWSHTLSKKGRFHLKTLSKKGRV